MKSNFKKLFILALSCVMAFTSSISAFAEEDEAPADTDGEETVDPEAYISDATDDETIYNAETREYEIRATAGETFTIRAAGYKSDPVSDKPGIQIAMTSNNLIGTAQSAEWECMAMEPGTYTITIEYDDGSLDIYTVYATYALSADAEALFSQLKAEWPAGVSAEREAIVRMALSGIGNITYNYGQSSDSYRTAEAKSLHCSQFVAWVYYQSGYTDFKWTKATEIQNRVDMTNIPYESIMPGDIGSVARDNGTGHCGIYLGTIGGVDYWCHSTTSGGIDGVRAGEYTSFNVYSRYNYLNDPAVSVDAVDETAIVTYADIQSTEGEVDEVPVVEDNDVGVVEEDETTDDSSTSSTGFGGEIVDVADTSSTTEDSADESASDEETEETVEEEVVVDDEDSDDEDVSVETTVDDEDDETVIVDDVKTSSDDAESSEDDEGIVSDTVQTADPYDLSLMIACAMLLLSGGSVLAGIKRMNA